MEAALVKIRSTHTLRRFCKRRLIRQRLLPGLGYRESIGSDFTPEELLPCRTRKDRRKAFFDDVTASQGA
jgi:hypothetical protein